MRRAPLDKGAGLLAPQIFDTQTIEPYPNVVIGKSPAPGLRYGLTAWLECSTPETGCHQISSPSAFGFTPWIDRDAGYYAAAHCPGFATTGKLTP